MYIIYGTLDKLQKMWLLEFWNGIENIKNTFILRPSLIGGNRDENRLGEQIGKSVMRFLNPLMIYHLDLEVLYTAVQAIK